MELFFESVCSTYNISPNRLSSYLSLKKRCCFIIQRGKKAGKMCMKNIINAELCDKHLQRKRLIMEREAKLVARKSTPATRTPRQKIFKNEFGDLEHTPTGYIFDDLKKVVGKRIYQHVHLLSDIDIESCKKYGFEIDQSKFTIPEVSVPRRGEVRYFPR